MFDFFLITFFYYSLLEHLDGLWFVWPVFLRAPNTNFACTVLHWETKKMAKNGSDHIWSYGSPQSLLLYNLTKIRIHLTCLHVIDIQTVYQQCAVAIYTTSPLSEGIVESSWWLYPVGGCLVEPAAVPDMKLLVIVLQALFSLYSRPWQSCCLFYLFYPQGSPESMTRTLKGPLTTGETGSSSKMMFAHFLMRRNNVTVIFCLCSPQGLHWCPLLYPLHHCLAGILCRGYSG